jgi:PAS domain S-box-containing protein
MPLPIRLLYVDDEPSLLDIGRLFLEETGFFSVATIDSAPAALELIKQEPFDAIVSDYQMPGMDGIRFLVEVRSQFGQIPFILFTGRGREEIVIQAINSGANFYLQKGGDPGAQFAELSHKIRTAVMQRTNELAFRESEERFRAISEYSHNAICIIDERAKIVWANDKMVELGGYSPDKLYATESFVVFLAPESAEFVISNFQKVLLGEPYEHHYSFSFIRADGEKRLCEKHMMDVVDTHGRRNLIISMLDVTDAKRADEELIKKNEELHASYQKIAASEQELRLALDDLTRQEQALRASQRELADIIEFLPDASFVIDIHGTVVAWNRAIEEMTGIKKEDMIGKGDHAYTIPFYGGRRQQLLDLIDLEDEEISSRYQYVQRKGTTLYAETFCPALYGGKGAYVWATGSPLFDARGERIGAVESIRDITDRRRAEDALRIQHELSLLLNRCLDLDDALIRILDAALKIEGLDSGGIYLADPVTGELAIAAHRGLSPEFIAQISHFNADAPQVIMAKTGKAQYGSYSEIRPATDGVREHEELRALASVPVLHEGELIALLNMASHTSDDIAVPSRNVLETMAMQIGSTITRMRSRTVLKESEEQFRTITESSFDLISLLDLEGHYLYGNPAYTTVLGYSPGDITGKNAFAFVHPEDKERATSLLRQAMTEKWTTARITLRLVCRDGSYKWVDHRATLIADEKGAPLKILLMGQDITERKQAEEALHASEQKFRSLVEYALESILILDFTGMILFANDSAARMTEVDSGAALAGRNVMEFIAPESRQDVITDFLQVAQGHDAYVAHYHAISAQGKKFFAESIGKVITYEGKPAVLLSVRDVTEQHKAKEALVESNRKYAELFELGSEAVFLIDNETGSILETNAAAGEMYGYVRDALLSMKNTDLSAEKEETEKVTAKTPQGTVRIPLRYHRRADGTVFPVEILGRFFILNGRPVHIAAVRDITEREHEEESLRKSHDRFEEISGHSREMVWEVDTRGTYTYVSPVSHAIIGYTPEELTGKKHFYDLHPEAGRESFKASLLEAFERKRVFHDLQNLRQTKDGEILWISTNGMPVFDEFNNFSGYRGSDSDITEKKQSEEIRTRFGRILESSLNEIYFFDAHSLRFVAVNHGARENIGYTMDELRTLTPLNLTTEYTRESFETLLTPLRSHEKEIQVVFTVHKRKDGSLYPVEMHLQLAGNEVFPVFVAIILDITERRQTEDALRLANWKLNLLSGITRHDINNQMTVLLGYLSLLEMNPSDPSMHDYIRKMDISAQRISSMIQFTKEYDEIGITLPAWQDLRELATAAEKEVSFGSIQLKNDLPAGREVFAEPLIFKVFYNLMDNAVRYGDTITTVRFSVEHRSGDQIIVCEDDGVGIPADDKEKIFLRGFGKNTGLGLALSQEILEITGISIEETGEPGKGARFEMTVPKGMWRIVKGPT